jgi:transposase
VVADLGRRRDRRNRLRTDIRPQQREFMQPVAQRVNPPNRRGHDLVHPTRPPTVLQHALQLDDGIR